MKQQESCTTRSNYSYTSFVSANLSGKGEFRKREKKCQYKYNVLYSYPTQQQYQYNTKNSNGIVCFPNTSYFF